MRRRNPRPRTRPFDIGSGAPIIQSLMQQVAERPVSDNPVELMKTANLIALVGRMAKLEAQFGRVQYNRLARRNPKPRAPACARTTSAFS